MFNKVSSRAHHFDKLEFSMQQAILYFPIRKYRFMLQIVNTALEFLPLAGILTLTFRTLLYFFGSENRFFCIKRS